MAASKLERALAQLREQANEHAEMSRDFPLTGTGSLFGFLDDLDSHAASSAKPKAKIGARKGGLGRRIGG